MTRIGGLQNIRNMQAAVNAAAERSPGLTKPTLKRYSWSRLHVDLLDDNRWALVAKRANAPLPIVEAMIVRLENHANRSRPRGHVGDFSIEGMAARWNVEADLVARIYAELERSDIGWIDQEQLVTFWDRNPDIVDDTAAERQQRARDRKKGMRELASQARQGFITERQRLERELALKDSREPKTLMAAWAGLSTPGVTRDSVTVTTRPDQIINQDVLEKTKRGLPREVSGFSAAAYNSGDIVDIGKAQLWLNTDGQELICKRMMVLRTRASLLIERWLPALENDAVALVAIIRAAIASSAIGESFQTLIENQIGRHQQEADDGPKLPLPPVGLKRRSERGN
jgi:hypothetical protein